MKLFIKNSRYLTLFIALVTMVFITPFLAETDLGKWLTLFWILFLLIAIVFTALDKHWHFITVCIFAASIVILYALSTATGEKLYHFGYLAVSLVLFAMAIWLIFNELISPKRVTLNTIFAALSVYFLLGLIYADAYTIVELLYPNSFVFNSVHLAAQEVRTFNLIYFSFTSLTTVGFGDIIPTNDIARTLVVLEQTTGVLYLAVIVSRLVAGFKHHHRNQ